MTQTNVIESLDEEACYQRLIDLIRHKSYTQTDGERQLAERVHTVCQAMGLESRLQPVTGGRFNVIATYPGTGGGSSLLFNGHLDTNPVTTGWTVDPWGGVMDDEFIYGIGVSNMKAGDAAYLCAVEALQKAGIRPKGDVVLSFVVGELQGGIGTVDMIADGVQTDYFINSEPTDLQAITLHAGAFVFCIDLIGDTRHMSKREKATDALAAAAQLVPQINAMTFSGADRPEHTMVNRAQVGVMRAGLGDEFLEWRPPQVADRARLLGSGRYGPSQSIEGCLNDMRALCEGLKTDFPELSYEVSQREALHKGPSMAPFEVSPQSPVVAAINRAHETVRGTAQPTGPIAPPCFFGTDAAHLAVAGMEGVVCGPGGEFNTMPDERVRKSQFIDCVKMYILAILEICETE